jgi:biotin carboxyl carrier protein
VCPQVGDVVVKGQQLMTLEAMKMEVAVHAPCDGEVAALHFSTSQLAQQGDCLAVLVESG